MIRTGMNGQRRRMPEAAGIAEQRIETSAARRPALRSRPSESPAGGHNDPETPSEWDDEDPVAPVRGALIALLVSLFVYAVLAAVFYAL